MPSSSRKVAAATTGPVTIDASLLGHGGVISVRTEADCERASLVISTTDENGPAADAVRDATLRQSATGLNAVVHVRHVRIAGNATVVQGSAPIEITAIVPPGSKVIGHTQSADIEAIGSFALVSGHTHSGDLRVDDAEKVTASTQSGNVTVNEAADISAKTQSGDVHLNLTDVVDASTMSGGIAIRDFGGTARLKTMSGSISVHATAGGDIDANTMSGDIEVTATQAAMEEHLDVRPRSMSGRINVPSRRAPGRHRRSF